MDPTVVAAWIAAGVSALTLAGTLVAQYLGYRATGRDAEKTAAEQRKQLDLTFAEQRTQLDRTLQQQREHLDRTLAEQNQQLDRTLSEQRTRTLNERFATAASQLGDDKPAAVRLAGVYAMAGLADDWEANRQTCVDVLCGYLRMPYKADPGEASSVEEMLVFQSAREVRHTVIRIIAAHLKNSAAVSWQGLNLDFSGVVFDGGSFAQAHFSGGRVSFDNAEFSGGKVSFDLAKFSGGRVSFRHTRFSGGMVSFDNAEFSGGEVDLRGSKFSGGSVTFGHAEFSGSTVGFDSDQFSGSTVSFDNAEFSSGLVSFGDAEFSGGRVSFTFANLSGGDVSFYMTKFSGGKVKFRYARFSGSNVSFDNAGFFGGTVDLSEPKVWSRPPIFSLAGAPPSGVELPENPPHP